MASDTKGRRFFGITGGLPQPGDTVRARICHKHTTLKGALSCYGRSGVHYGEHSVVEAIVLADGAPWYLENMRVLGTHNEAARA